MGLLGVPTLWFMVHEAYSQACLTEEIETNRISVFSLMIYILETNNQR